jgi:hypothetical protein
VPVVGQVVGRDVAPDGKKTCAAHPDLLSDIRSAAKLEFETEQAFSPSRKFRKKLWGDLTWIPGQPLNHRSRRHCPEAPSWSRAGGIAARDDAARAGAARSQDINPIQALPVLLSFCLPSR